MISEAGKLPEFKYFPRALENELFSPGPEKCPYCNEVRSPIFTGCIYSAEEKEPICAWCLAEGRVKEIDGLLNEVNQLEEAGVDPEIIDIIATKTPNFTTWQDWSWPAHCGTAVIFLSAIDRAADLKRYPGSEDALKTALKNQDIEDGDDNLDWYVDADGIGLYLFKYPNCGDFHAEMDFT